MSAGIPKTTWSGWGWISFIFHEVEHLSITLKKMVYVQIFVIIMEWSEVPLLIRNTVNQRKCVWKIQERISEKLHKSKGL